MVCFIHLFFFLTCFQEYTESQLDLMIQLGLNKLKIILSIAPFANIDVKYKNQIYRILAERKQVWKEINFNR